LGAALLVVSVQAFLRNPSRLLPFRDTPPSLMVGYTAFTALHCTALHCTVCNTMHSDHLAIATTVDPITQNWLDIDYSAI
jgi:hypothetical protein